MDVTFCNEFTGIRISQKYYFVCVQVILCVRVCSRHRDSAVIRLINPV